MIDEIYGTKSTVLEDGIENSSRYYGNPKIFSFKQLFELNQIYGWLFQELEDLLNFFNPRGNWKKMIFK